MSQDTKYLVGQSSSVLSGFTWRNVENCTPYILPYLKPDMLILDVGCGPGTITIGLASRVPHGRVVGLDRVPEPLEAGRKLAAEAGVTNITFQEGDILSLPFPDGSFDLVHGHQVVQHSTDPVRALREMRRVARPGGLVALRESDTRSAVWFPDVPGLQEFQVLCPRVAQWHGWEMASGRRLVSWALEAGFKRESITATAGAWCYSSPEERAYWSKFLTGALMLGDIGKVAVKQGLATQEDVEQIAEGFKEWATKEDGWYASMQGEIVCRVSG
ncbi:S-adenosyl-L-methionine-dependent methyltransferase [Obba rivulosa]|uniref:S-adenosyl-L-methionine-dependent methyltransferase n=1 Tax=Obba rivulosa TaxID=1052685 RepID=A0A8E2AWY1_9APHY|nr:S-adenosyl-L-methionine-dependent methyltransferase [Obba rivulosa]